MFMRLFLLFTLVPMIELALLVWTGSQIGTWPTLAIVILTGLIGSYLAKREGLRVLREYQQALAEMRMPEEGLTSALLVFAAGILLIAPGVLTDITGILLMIPAVRKPVARWLSAQVQGGLQNGSFSGTTVRSVSGAGFGMRGFQVHVARPQGVAYETTQTGQDGEPVVAQIVGRPRPSSRPSQRPLKQIRGVIDGSGELIDEHEK